MKSLIVNNQKGQTLVEYLILVAIVGVGSILIVSTLGQNLNNRFAQVITSMGGKTTEQVSDVTVSKEALQQRNLSNFMTGVSGENQKSNR